MKYFSDSITHNIIETFSLSIYKNFSVHLSPLQASHFLPFATLFLSSSVFYTCARFSKTFIYFFMAAYIKDVKHVEEFCTCRVAGVARGPCASMATLWPSRQPSTNRIGDCSFLHNKTECWTAFIEFWSRVCHISRKGKG